jgi:redox-sensitive bicupin YhaK (pirin superfamily)
MSEASSLPADTVDVRPGASRFHTRLGWLDSWHSFSFGSHHDPANVGHGLLLVSNDDTVAPGGGFGTHGHADMEIVTWVLSGELEHRDSAGNEGLIGPGLAQRMSAGRGIRHSEMNHSATEPVHFVQMWVPPDRAGVEPGYEQRDVSGALAAGGLVAVASGRGHEGAVHLHQTGAVLWVARLDEGEAVTVPDAPFVHLFVARGSALLGDGDGGRPLQGGDAARLSGAGARPLTAVDPAEVLIWETEPGPEQG